MVQVCALLENMFAESFGIKLFLRRNIQFFLTPAANKVGRYLKLTLKIYLL